MNCPLKRIISLSASRLAVAAAILWYSLWTSGAVLASLDQAKGPEQAPAPAAATVAVECSTPKACCCKPEVHTAGKCCCPTHASAPVPGVLSWTVRTCGDAPENSAIPESSRIPPHIHVCYPVPHSQGGGELVASLAFTAFDAPARELDKVPLPALL